MVKKQTFTPKIGDIGVVKTGERNGTRGVQVEVVAISDNGNIIVKTTGWHYELNGGRRQRWIIRRGFYHPERAWLAFPYSAALSRKRVTTGSSGSADVPHVNYSVPMVFDEQESEYEAKRQRIQSATAPLHAQIEKLQDEIRELTAGIENE